MTIIWQKVSESIIWKSVYLGHEIQVTMTGKRCLWEVNPSYAARPQVDGSAVSLKEAAAAAREFIDRLER